ncbi:hypothetical protein C8R44DRAFT_724852 [Mycena epipterygia]|nr:hypothetical protein C8R44DRAFT_724852 [Mycena epipterygia]
MPGLTDDTFWRKCLCRGPKPPTSRTPLAKLKPTSSILARDIRVPSSFPLYGAAENSTIPNPKKKECHATRKFWIEKSRSSRSWCMESLLHYKRLRLRQHPSSLDASIENDCRDLLGKLRVFDPARRRRYEDIGMFMVGELQCRDLALALAGLAGAAAEGAPQVQLLLPQLWETGTWVVWTIGSLRAECLITRLARPHVEIQLGGSICHRNPILSEATNFQHH